MAKFLFGIPLIENTSPKQYNVAPLFYLIFLRYFYEITEFIKQFTSEVCSECGALNLYRAHTRVCVFYKMINRIMDWLNNVNDYDISENSSGDEVNKRECASHVCCARSSENVERLETQN